MTYRIRILSPAENDVLEVVDWMANRFMAPRGAADWMLSLERALKSVAAAPESFGLAPEAERTGRDLRQFFFKTRSGRTYRGLFRIEGDEVVILRVRGPGQPPLELVDLQ